jgi:hypothetical protein
MRMHSKATIVSMAVIASSAATLLHEGLGHGVTAWLRGDVVTELTSNHLSSLYPDHWVEAAGTIVNLAVGLSALGVMRLCGERANPRYFLWLLAALNLLPAAGYFMLSGIFAFGDWWQVVKDLPHLVLVRVWMTLVGMAAYVGVVRLLAVGIRPFVDEPKTYNTVGRLPYYAAGLFSCLAGAFDPLGGKLLLMSTVPAAFGGSSGMLWADSLIPAASGSERLIVTRQRGWWVAAIVLGGAYVWFLGRGIEFAH